MILLKKDHHAVRQHDSLWLLRFECRQWRNWNFLPVAGLSGGAGDGRSQRSGQDEKSAENIPLHCPCHCAPPRLSEDSKLEELESPAPESLEEFSGSCFPAPAAGDTASITPTVRFVSTNVWLATRRMSA